MQIYIDESGSFTLPKDKRTSISCVGALLIPDSQADRLFLSVQNLLREWDYRHEELKGKNLSEHERTTVFKLLSEFEVTTEIVCIDLGLHKKEHIEECRRMLVEALGENLSSEHHENLVKQVKELQQRLTRLPAQLFVQLHLMTILVDKVVRTGSFYYAQRIPIELSRWHWVIDSKQKNQTEYEALWRDLMRCFTIGATLPKNPKLHHSRH